MSSPVLNPAGLSAVWKRQLGSLLGNPLGYLFILVFVVAAAAVMFFFDEFFNRNISDLAPLWDDKNWIGMGLMPVLLAILLPVLAMGAWASERELGTEELLLTLPLSIADAILGKYLAILTYFTIALGFSLSNVVILGWLGTPDYGLVFANYLGWWLGGAVLGAGALLGSVLVGLPAIALVVGLIICGLVLAIGNVSEWFDPFNRGLFPTGNIVAALGLIAVFLGLAMLVLASRRWRPATQGQVWSQVASLILGLILAVNVARIANRNAVDVDLSSEGLASVSADSNAILGKIQTAVAIHAFISPDLPKELQVKAKEVEDKLKAVERLGGGKITLSIHQPADNIEGSKLSSIYGIKPRRTVADTVAGREFVEVFLGAVVSSGSRSTTIEHFDPGLSVEYELIRAVRAVAEAKKPVLGVAETDLKITGDFDMQTYQQIPGWEVVEEWRKRYEVRPVNLDQDVSDEISVLVAPQPSTLTQPQIEKLHDYIWAGRPCLILEDALPLFSMQGGRYDLIPRMPKKGAQGQMGQPPPEGAPQKGDIKTLFRALGLDYHPDVLVWSDYNPSHEFRGLIEMNLVWASRDHFSFSDNALTSGINSVLLPAPSTFKIAASKAPSLEVAPLIKIPRLAPWGENDFEKMVFSNPFNGQVQIKKPDFSISGDPANPPMIAAEVTGTMPSAYARAAKEEKKDTDKDKKDEAKPAGEVKVGQPSAKPIRVVVIGDTDFSSNEIYGIYVNRDSRIDRNKFRFLTDLRNIQLIDNAVDSLFGDRSLVELRTRQPQPRPLKRHEDVYLATQAKVREEMQSAELEQTTQLKKAQDRLDDAVKAIDKREDDDNTKARLKEEVKTGEQRKVEAESEIIKQNAARRINLAKAEQRTAIKTDRSIVKAMAMGIPTALLAILALAVLINRVAAERSHIPSSRKRNVA